MNASYEKLSNINVDDYEDKNHEHLVKSYEDDPEEIERGDEFAFV